MMRQLRLIFIALISFLFVTSAVLLRRTVSVLLCGVLSFNSTSCYSFLNKYEIVNAAVPPSTTVLAADDSSSSQKDEQKIAGFFDLPKIPISIPGIPGGNPLGVAKTAIVKQIGEAVGVGSPLLLDQKTAYADVSDQVKDFHPQKLTITSAEDLQKPLSPGDYSLDVIAYCTQFSIHAPGRGLPYKLAPLTGKQAPAISALLSRGTLQGIAPATLNANAWRIQAGLPLKQWPSQDQALIHKLIPEYEKGLEGDYLQQIENTYNQFRLVPGIPSLNDLLTQSGAPGQTVLQLRQARQTLANQTISAERLPDMLYEPTGDGLPRVLPASKDSSPSHWAEVQPGVFARFTVIEGHLGRNLLEFRVTSKASAAINNFDTVATKELDKNLQVSEAKMNSFTLGGLLGADGSTGVIGYSIGRAAQALMPHPNSVDASCKDKELTVHHDQAEILKQWNEIGKILTNYYLSNDNQNIAGFAHQMYNLYTHSFDEKSQKNQSWAGDFTRSALFFAAKDIERRKDFWKDPPNIYKGFWPSLGCTLGGYALAKYDCGAANAGANHFKEHLEPAFYEYIKSKLDLVAANSCPENLKNNLISSIKEIREEHIQLLNKAVIPGLDSVTEMSEYARKKAQEEIPTKAATLRISTFSKVLLPLLEPGKMTEMDIREVEKEALKP